MDRRNFLRMLVGGVAASAAVRTFPFRVFSFPSEIIRPQPLPIAWSNVHGLEVGQQLSIYGTDGGLARDVVTITHIDRTNRVIHFRNEPLRAHLEAHLDYVSPLSGTGALFLS